MELSVWLGRNRFGIMIFIYLKLDESKAEQSLPELLPPTSLSSFAPSYLKRSNKVL